MSDSITGFNPYQPRYDQSTFRGRLKHFMDLGDPRCLAPKVFFGMSLNDSVQLLSLYHNHRLPAGVTAEQLWLAKKISQAAIHPDTGKEIPQPFRISGFAIYGTPIVVGMLLPNPSLRATVFWQALNQVREGSWCGGERRLRDGDAAQAAKL